MTCWPQGKEELPIRNRTYLAPQVTRKIHTPQQSCRAGRWDPARHSQLPQNCGPNTHAKVLCCDLDWTVVSCHLWGAHDGRGPKHQAPRLGCGNLHRTHRTRAAGTAFAPVMPRLRIGAELTTLEAAALYQNRKGKATTFFIQNFSQIYRIIAFICLFVF